MIHEEVKKVIIIRDSIQDYLIFPSLILSNTRMWIVPFIRGETGHDEEGEADQAISGQDISETNFAFDAFDSCLVTTYSQISTARGFMNEKSLVGLPLGILYKMEMPRFMKGSENQLLMFLSLEAWFYNRLLVKSITASRAKLMVMAPMAKSASPSIRAESER